MSGELGQPSQLQQDRRGNTTQDAALHVAPFFGFHVAVPDVFPQPPTKRLLLSQIVGYLPPRVRDHLAVLVLSHRWVVQMFVQADLRGDSPLRRVHVEATLRALENRVCVAAARGALALDAWLDAEDVEEVKDLILGMLTLAPGHSIHGSLTQECIYDVYMSIKRINSVVRNAARGQADLCALTTPPSCTPSRLRSGQVGSFRAYQYQCPSSTGSHRPNPPSRLSLEKKSRNNTQVASHVFSFTVTISRYTQMYHFRRAAVS